MYIFNNMYWKMLFIKKTLSFRLKEHVEDKNKLPILIFPEGRWTYVAHVM